MLVLTRKKSEEIKIGNDITIKVIQTGKGTIKLGIEAPKNVRVLRGELKPFEEETEIMTEMVAEANLEESDDYEEVPLAPLHRQMTQFRMSRAMCEMA